MAVARVDGSYALNPGRLRHRLTLQRCIKTQDGYGQDVLAWTDTTTFWAQVRAMQGRELETARQTWAEARFKIRMWHPNQEIRREDRLVWDERTLDILDAEDPDGTGREMLIIARELVL